MTRLPAPLDQPLGPAAFQLPGRSPADTGAMLIVHK